MATSMPANANSPANISPVGPPPTIITACSIIVLPPLRGRGSGRQSYERCQVLKQVPGAPYVKIREGRPRPSWAVTNKHLPTWPRVAYGTLVTINHMNRDH